MRRTVCLVVFGMLLGSCSESSNGGAADTAAPLDSTPGASTAVIVDTSTSVDSTVSTTTFTEATAPPAPKQRALFPDPMTACSLLDAAATSISAIAQGQDPPALALASDGDGFGCSMTWDEPDSTSMTASFLLYSKPKMLAELQRVGYVCDPTPVPVPGWPSALRCSTSNASGLHDLIWLDNGLDAVSLSFWGPSNRGLSGQAVVAALVIALGPPRAVDISDVPPTTMSVAPVPTSLSGGGPLPSEVWDGKYVAEPRSGPLRIGDQGQRVAALQRGLGLNGLLDPPYDGYFGPDTEQAVVTFQRDNGHAETGIAGPEVLDAMPGG